MANYLSIYLGRDGHASTHPIWKEYPLIWEGVGMHLPIHFGKEYPLICEGMTSNLPTHLGGDCHLSTNLFWRGWKSICPFIWKGNATYLPIWVGMANYLPIDMGGDGCVSTHSFGKEYPGT